MKAAPESRAPCSRPPQALAYLDHVLARQPEISVVGIAGPGDPFANPEETMQTLRLVRGKYPKMMLCLATNGLGIGPYIDELADLQVSHVTLTITAIDPAIASEIYAWIRDGKRPLRGEEAASLLIARQTEALFRLKSKGIVVKINTIIIPGINDEHIPDIARKVGGMGADIMNCMPLVPVKGAAFEELPQPDSPHHCAGASPVGPASSRKWRTAPAAAPTPSATSAKT